MTKADWLDFFEAINGRSATEEEMMHQQQKLLQHKNHQRNHNRLSRVPKKRNHNRLSRVPKKRNHSQLSLVPKKRNHSRLLRVHKTRNRKLLLQMLRQHNLNQPLRALKLLQYKEYQIKRRNHKLVLPMLKLVNKQLLLTLNLFNQVKTFNLSMAKPQLFQHNHQHLRQLSKTTGHGCLMHGVVQLT